MIPLGLLAVGEIGEILPGTRAPDATCATRAEDMGLRAGKRVEMLTNGTGPVLVKVDETRIALDRGLAMRIKVRT